jgi:predicted lipoprotein with Yx(FWY)xxD motif
MNTMRDRIKAATGRVVRMQPGDALVRVAALGTVGLLVLSGAATLARGSTTTAATVAVHKTPLGMVLADAKGHTLYLVAKDRNDRSACSGACAGYWPPLLTTAKPRAGAGIKAALLGTTRRGDGHLQVTYKRHPLYLFALDQAAGHADGEGMTAFGGRWWVVSAKGTAVMKAAPSTTTTSRYPYG